jgi:hypothetical protein
MVERLVLSKLIKEMVLRALKCETMFVSVFKLATPHVAVL